MQTGQKNSGQKIKRLLVGWGPWALLTLGSLWLIQGALAMTKGHGVILRGLNYDAGTVKAGAVVTDEIRVTNLSSQPVWVYAQPGCGCTVIDVPSTPLSPLHTEIVKAQVDTSGIQLGAQRRAVMLQMQSGESLWQQTAIIQFQLK